MGAKYKYKYCERALRKARNIMQCEPQQSTTITKTKTNTYYSTQNLQFYNYNYNYIRFARSPPPCNIKNAHYLASLGRRLGANSLLDIVVFGRACALRIAEIAKPGDPAPAMPEHAGLDSLKVLDDLRFADGDKPTSEIRMEVSRWSRSESAGEEDEHTRDAMNPEKWLQNRRYG